MRDLAKEKNFGYTAEQFMQTEFAGYMAKPRGPLPQASSKSIISKPIFHARVALGPPDESLILRKQGTAYYEKMVRLHEIFENEPSADEYVTVGAKKDNVIK